MSEQTYRNHPTVIIQNVVAVAIIIGFIFITWMGSSKPPIETFYILLAILVAWMALAVLSWKRTTITFQADQIIVEHNVVYKKKKTIPYSKIASANVVRNLFNRIFGTTTLQININSSTRAAEPEVRFVFKKDLADQLRIELMSSIFKQEFDPIEENNHESVLKFKNTDAILYGIIGGSSWSFLNAIFWSAFSIISLMFSSGGGFIISFLMLLASSIQPIVGLIFKYYNFKVYRIDDNIRLQHGLIQTYNTSFDVRRINAIRVRRPFFARMIHRCCIEAEVVGINAAAKDTTPLICLLIKEEELDHAMRSLVPEFIRDILTHPQPESAKFPLLSKTTYATIAWILIMAYPCWAVQSMTSINGVPDYAITMMKYLLPVLTILIGVALYYGAFVSYKTKQFGMGKDMFTIVNGIVDRETLTIQYDRVQITEVYATPMPRRFGLAKIKISLLSSSGAKTTKSGYFQEEELSKVSENIMERLSSGEYDYRMTEM